MPGKPIIHHTALAKSGGATRVARLLFNGLAQQGFDVRHSYEASENAGERLISPEEAAAKIPANALVHLHSSADPQKFIRSLPAGAKIVITLHDAQMITGGCAYPLDCEHFERQCLDPCPRNFTNSRTIRAKNVSALLDCGATLVSPSGWLARLTRGCHENLKVKVIPNGIPWPEKTGDKKEARKNLAIHPASKVVLFIAHGGFDAAYKAGPYWKDYWLEIKKQTPGAVAFAIGGTENKRDGDLISVPYVDRKTLNTFMLAADVFAYPTLADNHPLLILEAMSNALPAISYAVGGITEQIRHESTGILVPPYEKNIFTDQIINLLHNSRKCKEIGLNAFHTGSNNFACTRMLNSYLKIYGNSA